MDQPGITGLMENPNLSETDLEIQLITLMYSELIKETGVSVLSLSTSRHPFC